MDVSYWSIVLSAVAILSGGVATYLAARGKTKSEQAAVDKQAAVEMAANVESIKLEEFAAIIKANEVFRLEVKADLDASKKELVSSRDIIMQLNETLLQYYDEIHLLRDEIRILKDELMTAKETISLLRKELSEYERSA